MFVLEPHDEHVLRHPKEAILDTGGVILMAQANDGTIIGTGALMPSSPGVYELTKMGVTESSRGQKSGEALLDALIEAAADKQARALYLLTNSICAAAIHLYEKAGFIHDADIMARYGSRYARCDVAMSYPIRNHSAA